LISDSDFSLYGTISGKLIEVNGRGNGKGTYDDVYAMQCYVKLIYFSGEHRDNFTLPYSIM
jgi:hypothetical protein